MIATLDSSLASTRYTARSATAKSADTTASSASSSASDSTEASASTRSSSSDMQDRFLKLLVAQMRNQDPLNPLDNAQVTSQMAQISTVSGIEKLNSSMASIGNMVQATRTMQATAMLGHSVVTEGNKLQLSNASAGGGFIVGGAADRVTVQILDSSGNVLETQNYSSLAAGKYEFSWDGTKAAGGTATDGVYSFKVQAWQGDKAVDVTALQVSKVSSVALGSGDAKLNLANGGQVAIDDVIQVI